MLRFAFALPFFISACFEDETTSGYADPDAIYVLKEVNGAAFKARATINFPEEGKIAGAAPCNTFSGNQEVPYPWFEAREIATTELALDLRRGALRGRKVERASEIAASRHARSGM